LKAAVAALEREVGPTDVLLPCAGMGTLSTANDLDLEGFRSMLEVNVLGVARTIEAVLPGMFARGRGHIVGIASVAGYRGLPWMPGYSASKAALATYLEGLRPALKRRGVRITTVYPGFVRTAMTVDTPFRRPVKMLEPAEAAEYVVRAIARRPRDLTFPFSAAFGMGLLRRMPGRVYDWLMDRAGPEALTTEF
jgi:short-subunit dehydrogenase